MKASGRRARPRSVPHVVCVVITPTTRSGRPGGYATAAFNHSVAAGGDRCRDARGRDRGLGFVYYGRHFRSRDGSQPPRSGPACSITTRSRADVACRQRHLGDWDHRTLQRRAACEPRGMSRCGSGSIASYALIAHWLNGDPMTDIQLMAKIEDRHRCFVVDGRPVATGVAPSPTRGPARIRRWVAAPRSASSTPKRSATSSATTPSTSRRVRHRLARHTVERVEPLYRDTLRSIATASARSTPRSPACLRD